jgi:cell division protein FtsN
MFIGFVLGLVSAATIAVYLLKTPIPFLDRSKPAERPAPAGQNLKDAPGSAQKDDGKPRFDFYRILPGQEEPVSNEQLKQAADREKSGKAVIEGKEIYLLQAGSFQNPADADNMKAKLALLGLEANVEATNIPDKGVMYRVRLGPFEKIEEINRVRSQLAQNGIEPSLVRVRDSKN